MVTKVTGIVIKEYVVGESDKFITLFTKEMGKIQASAPKAKKFDRGLTSGTQPFVYGEFVISGYRDTYRLLSVDVKHSFYQLSQDLLALSYGSYIVEFVTEVATQSSGNEALLNLMLHTLNRLTKEKKSYELIRCVFEIRAMVELGFMLELERCINCQESIDFEKEGLYVLNIKEGGMMCKKCIEGESLGDYSHTVDYTLWYTLRFITYHSNKDAFKFTTDEVLLKKLRRLTQDYVTFYIEKDFKTLAFIEQLEKL